MRFGLWHNKFITYGFTFLAGMAFAWLAVPLWRGAVMAWHQEKYGLLVEQCDTAMRDHLQARQTVEFIDDAEANLALQSAELGLVVCQDYDMYQKRLLQFGLREDELSQMRLRAIEARATDLQEVIDTHEIRF